MRSVKSGFRAVSRACCPSPNLEATAAGAAKVVAKHWRETCNDGKEDRAMFFVERGGLLVIFGIESGYTPDGIVMCHLFLLRTERALGLVVLLLR